MKKRSIYLMGLITLVVFPIPAFVVLYFFEDIFPQTILQLNSIDFSGIAIGLLLGVVYAILALFIMQAKVFEKLPSRIEQIVKDMNLTLIDCVFLSICAGVGEELLFRSGMQFYLGPILTSVIFVAIHGYLNPWNWRMSLYGLIVLPFILLISYGFETMGLWFAVSAHFSYDLVLFIIISESWKKKPAFDQTPINSEEIHE
ncbi:MAG: CPBP family intramembrane metalloprotease [Fluviicola sp.]|nr:CPBP family intramembrane metalloprotease [Fluviicola sp.]